MISFCQFFPARIYRAFLINTVRVMCFILMDFINLLTFDEEYRLWSSLLCAFQMFQSCFFVFLCFEILSSAPCSSCPQYVFFAKCEGQFVIHHEERAASKELWRQCYTINLKHVEWSVNIIGLLMYSEEPRKIWVSTVGSFDKIWTTCPKNIPEINNCSVKATLITSKVYFHIWDWKIEEQLPKSCFVSF